MPDEVPWLVRVRFCDHRWRSVASRSLRRLHCSVGGSTWHWRRWKGRPEGILSLCAIRVSPLAPEADVSGAPAAPGTDEALRLEEGERPGLDKVYDCFDADAAVRLGYVYRPDRCRRHARRAGARAAHARRPALARAGDVRH